MRESPPPQLIALLERLNLATEAQVRRMGRRVTRLAGELPRFESVWVDALAQARILTPLQAAEINAGRGPSLRVGPYVLCERLLWPNYVACYRARRLDSGAIVRLVVDDAGDRAEELRRGLATLAAASEKCQSEHVAAVAEAGGDGDRLWAAAPWVEGRSAAQWMVHNGRFPPEVVLEIARAMLAGLVALEQSGICHGDISAAGLVLTDSGRVVLPQPGIRGVFRPHEGYAHADLPPETYDYLAPERITRGTPPTTASDLYACGCVWWHLLCGRPPLPGGDSLAKLRAAQAAELPDVRRFAPEVPGPLAAALTACLQREPLRRPDSMARLAAALGPPTRNGRYALARCLAGPSRAAARWPVSVRATRRWSVTPLALAGMAVCLVAAASILWPLWDGRWRLPAANIPGRRTEPVAERADGQQDVAADNELVAKTPRSRPQDLVLASGGPLDGQSLDLRAGQRVRGMSGKRPVVMVPRTGLVVGADGVCFEGIDFVWDHAAETNGGVDSPAWIIHLRCARAEFRGCSFQAMGAPAAPLAAIGWSHPADPGSASLSLPNGRVGLSNCVLGRVGAGIECRTIGALSIELSNTLHLGSGPLVRLDHGPNADEPVQIIVSQVTLRGTGPLLECHYQQTEGQPGEVAVQAAGCAFVPQAGTPLLLFCGPDAPTRLVGAMRWTGQGSLVSPGTVIAAWRRPDGGRHALDEAAVSMAGLVRSDVGFAGDRQAGPAANAILRWQAPLQSADAPGIDPRALPQR